MNERLERVLQKMEKKGIDQLLVSDPLSIRFLTGIMVHPGERLYALLLRTNGKHTMFLNYLYYVSDTGFEEVWFSDMDDQIGVLTEHIDTKGVIGIDKTFHARFLIPLQERCPSALAASTEQESTGFSSKNTVQSPQLEVSQPRFTL